MFKAKYEMNHFEKYSALCPKSTILHIDQCGNEKELKPAISNTINTKWVTVEMQ